jgi:hypothetical protein
MNAIKPQTSKMLNSSTKNAKSSRKRGFVSSVRQTGLGKSGVGESSTLKRSEKQFVIKNANGEDITPLQLFRKAESGESGVDLASRESVTEILQSLESLAASADGGSTVKSVGVFGDGSQMASTNSVDGKSEFEMDENGILNLN